jgi:hypothetical protein
MLKKISILVATAGCAFILAAAGCDDTTNNINGSDGGQADLAMAGGGDGGGADMAFVCSQNPTNNAELLNSCAPASVDKVDIVPFYPSLAPNGVLPALP